jgi:hypothetical protein
MTRLFLYYISFVTAGLWFGVYLTLVFWMLKDLIQLKELQYLTCNNSIYCNNATFYRSFEDIEKDDYILKTLTSLFMQKNLFIWIV